MSQNEQVRRIRNLELDNFRGFVGTHEIDTDADVVLCEGPNGSGKTSLLEAVALLLTGWPRVPRKHLFALVPEGNREQTAEVRAHSFRIRARVQRSPDDGGSGGPLEMCEKDPEQKKTTVQVPANLPGDLVGHRGEPSEADVELAARVCAFFQDDVQRLFDEFSKGTTLRDVLEPLPSYWRELPGYLDAIATDIDAELRRTRAEEDSPPAKPEASLAGLQQAFHDVRPPIMEVIQRADSFPEPPESVDDEHDLSRWAAALLERAGKPRETSDARVISEVFNELESELARQIVRAGREAASESTHAETSRRQLEAVNSELDALAREWPRLDEELALFAPSEPGGADALRIFRALGQDGAAWGHAEAQSADASTLRRPLAELRAVVGDEAEKCAQALEDWLRPRRQAYAKRQELLEHRQQLERALRRAVTSADLERLRRARRELDRTRPPFQRAWELERHRLRWEAETEGRRRASAHLGQMRDAVDRLKQAVEKAVAPNEELMNGLTGLANQVADRLSMSEGVRPLQLEAADDPDGSGRRHYTISTRDKRKLSDLSTGQRGQTAAAFLVSQNLAARSYLGHQVIVLDDVTTAYDLSNLTREAILWRQLAYGQTGEERRQLFISSHHEDLTNQMLDLLIPPEGRRMRLLRFGDWSPTGGPNFEQLEVEPTGGTGGAHNGTTAMHDERCQGLFQAIEDEPWASS